ncbi:MAG: hypothetical protein GFGODING_01994 [Flavobacteriales bacterium]|nr:hypothetical protein [Flavobacteriales bacterium]
MSPSLLVRACCTALLLAAGTNARSSHHVQGTDAALGTSEPIEANEKTVNAIYLATIGKDVDDFTATQAADLFFIANQCPMVGGNAVFKARSLYWLIDDTYNFDDPLLCLPYGIIVKSLGVQQISAVSILPNPASDEATLVLSRKLYEPGTFMLYDALGMEVLRRTVPIETLRLVFSTASLAPALYHYLVRDRSGTIGYGKLTVVR